MEKNPEIQRDSTTVDQPPRAADRRAGAAPALGSLAVSASTRPASGDSTADWVGSPTTSSTAARKAATRHLGASAVRQAERDRSR